MRKKYVLLALSLSLVVVLSACGNGSGVGARSRVPTVSPQRAAVLAQGRQIADQVVQQLQESGLPIGERFACDMQTDPDHLLGTPGQYVGKVNFWDTRFAEQGHGADLSVVDGGTIQVFANMTDANAADKYIKSMSSTDAMFFTEYDYWNGVVLLRLSSQLSPGQAKAYQTAFMSIQLPTAINA